MDIEVALLLFFGVPLALLIGAAVVSAKLKKCPAEDTEKRARYKSTIILLLMIFGVALISVTALLIGTLSTMTFM